MPSLRHVLKCVGLASCIMLASCIGREDKFQPREYSSGYRAFVQSHRTPSECINLDTDLSVEIKRDNQTQCIGKVKAFEKASCQGISKTVTHHPALFDKTMVFSGPLHSNYECAESVLVREASPCRLTELSSGGYSYRICTHDGKLIPLSWCEGHTNQCANH